MLATGNADGPKWLPKAEYLAQKNPEPKGKRARNQSVDLNLHSLSHGQHETARVQLKRKTKR